MHLLSYLLEHNRYLNIVGIFAILFIAFCFSRNRSKINVKLIVNGLLLQLVIGFLVLRMSIGQKIVSTIARYVEHIYECASEGSAFIFGNLINPTGSWGFIFAVKVLPIIIFFGALMALLFHIGLIQKIVSAVSFVIRPLLGTSGAETLCAIANSFLGQTEAPLLIRNYLYDMSKSEMLVVMVSGMATISGAILVVYAAMGVPAAHLLSASVMAIPASIVIAKIIYPETEKNVQQLEAQVAMEHTSKNALDAISQGTSDGLHLAMNVAAMLISFLALIALLNCTLSWSVTHINWLLSYTPMAWRVPYFTLDHVFSYMFAPFGYFLGLEGTEIFAAGQLIGTKVAINEMIAYSKMVTMNLSDRAANILTYALCGFSNFSCIGIQIGGIGALVPEKRVWLTELGWFAVLGGTLSNLLSAMIAGLLL